MRASLGVLLVGCSSVTPFPSDDIAQFDAGGFDSTVPKEASTFDVVSEPDGTTFGGGGPFDCFGCVCDGTLGYCVEMSGGKAPITDAGVDSSACDPEASACTPIPIDCLPKPTCDCVLTHYQTGCTCDVDISGNGLVVTCAHP